MIKTNLPEFHSLVLIGQNSNDIPQNIRVGFTSEPDGSHLISLNCYPLKSFFLWITKRM